MTSSKCYSTEEQITRTGIIVERFSEIEHQVNTIIFDFISPTIDAEEFVKTYLLDNSVVSFASKVKLLQVINRQKKMKLIDRDKFHRFLSIRNAFAHNNVEHKLELEYKENGPSDIYFYLDSMKGDGQLQRSKRDDLFDEFNTIFHSLQKNLQQLITFMIMEISNPTKS